jgi:hypothetical protein
MSQKVEIICDRCGNEISRYYDIKNASAKIQLWGVGEYRASGGQRIDLCEDCYADFVMFLEGGAINAQ